MYEIAKNSVQKLTPPWPAEPDLAIDQEWDSGEGSRGTALPARYFQDARQTAMLSR
jgi:hypothetical protein